MTNKPDDTPPPREVRMTAAEKLRQIRKAEGPDSMYVAIGEMADSGEEPEFSRPGDVLHDT